MQKTSAVNEIIADKQISSEENSCAIYEITDGQADKGKDSHKSQLNGGKIAKTFVTYGLAAVKPAS
jgi:hypothetical protein